MSHAQQKCSGDHESRTAGAVSKAPTGKTRILVADDHPLVREALGAVISRHKNYVLCGDAASTVETQKAVALLKPDLILLDLWLGDGDGLELIKTLTETNPTMRILVISQSEGTLHAEQALRAGANGFVMKDQPAGEILSAIQAVLSGEIYVSPRVADRAQHTIVEDRNPRVESLSGRELQILRLLGAGMGTRKIAEELQLSSKTVETHREHIKHKIGLSDAQELARYAIYCTRNLKSAYETKLAV